MPPNATSTSTSSDSRLLLDIQTLSRALSLSISTESTPNLDQIQTNTTNNNNNNNNNNNESNNNPRKKKNKNKKPSFWSSKTFKNFLKLQPLRQFHCRFSIHLHSLQFPSQSQSQSHCFSIFTSIGDSSGQAQAQLGQTLTYSFPVSVTASGKYDPIRFLILVVENEEKVEVGRNLVDLTRLLPLSLEEVDGGMGRWTTSFALSGKGKGKGKGGVLNVSFEFEVVGRGGDGEEKNVVGGRRRERARSMEDVRVLHEVVLKSVKSEVSVLMGVDGEFREEEEEKFSAVEKRAEIAKGVMGLEKIGFGSEEKGVGIGGNYGLDYEEEEVCEKDNVCEANDVEKIDKEGETVVGNAEGSDEELDGVLVGLEEVLAQLEEGHANEEPMIEVMEWGNELACTFVEHETPDKMRYNEVELGYRGKSRSLEDEMVASEFLSMLGIDVNSPIGLSSDTDPDSPRGQLWKQFKEESRSTGNNIFGIGSDEDGDFLAEDFDLSSIVEEVETEFQEDRKCRAKMIEDAEAEALMRHWGLKEKDFHCSPPDSKHGFGSPIDSPPEEPIELPPLSEGLGPFVRTKDGGFLRSINPTLFKNAKNNGSLIMQVSNPVVVPAEMGNGIMEILQRLAAIGIEKLSMQAKKLMPLEDISGKTMQQIAWECSPSPSLESSERPDLRQPLNTKAEPGASQTPSVRKESSKISKIDSEYVSLEDLTPLAIEKIEALSIEGLRIQSGMTDEDAPSNISAQLMGDVSALEGKSAMNSMSVGLEGTGGLQLLDVKDDGGDDVDGLMSLSITLSEWMRLDSGLVDGEDDDISDRTSKILAAHHAHPAEVISCKGGGKRSGRRWGLLGNTFTVALMVQLRDPLRNYEPVGNPMLSLIQVERVFVPSKPKIYSAVSEIGNSEESYNDEVETNTEIVEEKKKDEDVVPPFKITEVHVAGLKTEPGKKKPWGNSINQQSGSRWLLATGMGKSNKQHPIMKSKAVPKPSSAIAKEQPGDTLWSITSRVLGDVPRWKGLFGLNPHIRNSNVILPNESF